MDMQIPDPAPVLSSRGGSPAPPPVFARHLQQMLLAAVPAGGPDDEAATQELLASLDLQEPADAMLAAIAVAAARSAMDLFARAARPGISDETAMRLRNAALAAGRTYATTRRDLRKRRPDRAERPQPTDETAAARPEAEARPPERPAFSVSHNLTGRNLAPPEHEPMPKPPMVPLVVAASVTDSG